MHSINNASESVRSYRFFEISNETASLILYFYTNCNSKCISSSHFQIETSNDTQQGVVRFLTAGECEGTKIHRRTFVYEENSFFQWEGSQPTQPLQSWFASLRFSFVYKLKSISFNYVVEHFSRTMMCSKLVLAAIGTFDDSGKCG